MYWFIFLRPASPSFLSFSKWGETAVSSCMMIIAEMYGMMLRAKIVMRLNAPPAKVSKMSRMPPDCRLKMSSRIVGSMPGSGM